MNREGKKCVLYPRVSTEMQVDGYSLEGQKNGLRRFADREEMEIVGIYEDAGKSGKSIEGRPAFKKMLSDIKNGLEIDYILVYKLSRFGRNAADILNSLEFVQSYGINLICIEEGIDSSQTSGKLLISVLSAVAEIERENIIEQTMNGRREKARQGGWNGGFAPYGYYLKDNQLLIEETEAEAIRIIFDKFANSDIGLGGVAKYLNLQGIKKIPRQNGTLETWSSHFIRLILDNPVYCGKIAYGRRTREKVKGTKNEYKQVHAEDYILEDGQHEGIISEELWQKVHAKRMATGIKQPSKIGKDRSHLLTGILKCPLCGSSMYTNKHAWTNKDGTYKEVYYYICGRNKQERGHHCDYKASLRKTDIEPLVIEAVKELVSDKYFAKEIEKRIGVQTDTTAIDKELANYESKLKEVDLNKARLEREIDNLPVDTRFRERKIHDMTLRLDALYDTIVELEERIEDAKLRKSSIEMETITLDNIYKLMLNFGKLYDIISDEEKKSLITYLIKEIQIYPNGESEQPLKSIEFNFPIYRDGQEVRRLLWEKGNTVDTVVFFQITDPKLYCYGVENPISAIENLSATTLRNIIGELELDSTLTSRDTINAKIRVILDEATDPWGIKVNRVELKNIIPPREIQDAMEKQMKAERERREAILRAEGEKQSRILVAEGHKESKILEAQADKQSAILAAEAEKEAKIREAEGEAEAIAKVQKATADAIKMLNEADANESVLKLKALEAFAKAADGQATKIIIPSEIQGIAGLAEGIIESVKK